MAILDADKAGFLRSETSLIQTIGRAARNVEGRVVMYADEITESMQYAIEETNRRRRLQSEYNRRHHITPKTIVKSVREVIDSTRLRENTNSDVVGEIASGGITKDGGRISSKAVSYTHLDVYKRQALHSLQRAFTKGVRRNLWPSACGYGEHGEIREVGRGLLRAD